MTTAAIPAVRPNATSMGRLTLNVLLADLRERGVVTKIRQLSDGRISHRGENERGP
jgi:hypothetical protein